MAKNAEKETALYEAVFRLLARGEKMYSVTVQQIAEEAGIGKGTVYEYFTSREEIISKAMAYRLRGEADALSERVDKAEGFEQKLDTLLCFARDSVQAQASGMKVLFASARTLESPEAVCRHIGDAQVVEQLRRKEGITVFLTTHYMEEAADADYVVILDKGKIAAEGTPLQLKNTYTGDFLTLYGVTESQVQALGLPYSVIRDAFRVSVSNTAVATELIVKHPALFRDYEITKGRMDNVFLAVTGKKLMGGMAE